jgi:Protein of unknown function (DUF2905)
MQDFGKVLVVLGIVIATVGFFLWKLAGKTPLGHLPGDISVQRPNFSFYFPITTCIVISIILTLLMWIFRR